MSFRVRVASATTLALGIGLLAAAPGYAVHQTAYGLTTQVPSQIVQFAVGTPAGAVGPTPITGLTAGDNLIGLDYRPRGTTLYGEADNGQLYTIAPPAGAVTTFTATPIGVATNPADADSGFDFNPVPDRLRVNNASDENFRINVDNGSTVTDGALAFAVGDANQGDDPAVGAAAYTNNFDGATLTTLFDIEAVNNALVTQNPPNSGTLNTVGVLPGGDISSVAGFDIETQTQNAYAALQTVGSSSSTFYRLDLASGAALNTFGTIAGGQLIEGVTLPPIPVLQFGNLVTSVAEGDTVTIAVSRQGPLNQQATVNYATELAAGDGAGDTDFTAATGTLTFAPGDSQESFTVATAEDALDEGDETFSVRLSAPSTTINLPTPPTTKVNVVDDDDAAVEPGKPGAAPIGLISVSSQKLKRSLKATFSCDEACAAALELRLGRKVLDRQTGNQGDPYGVNQVAFALSKAELKKVKKKAKRDGSAKLTVAGTFSDEDGSTTSKVSFQIG